MIILPTLTNYWFFQNCPLTHPHDGHKIAPNMLKSTRWFAFYFYYGFRGSVAAGGA